jgi:cytochrome c-type biogenesis protein CcmH/NrfG
VDPASAAGWSRLAEILDATGQAEQADEARARARRVDEDMATGRPGGAP